MPVVRRDRRFLAAFLPAVAPPIDLRILGRTLLHAAIVGLGAGLIGGAFYFSLELVQRILLEDACGYVPLRAAGEGLFVSRPHHYRWYLLLIMPALGALVSGALSILAPETRGGGG